MNEHVFMDPEQINKFNADMADQTAKASGGQPVPGYSPGDGSTGQVQAKLDVFEREVAQLINRNSFESLCDTPDFVLALFLRLSLENFVRITNQREDYCGR
jgi:hypothetical protein